MSQPSMAEASKIRDVAARHSYVFDNGLSSPDFFDVGKRMQSEEFGLLRERILKSHAVLEIGCFTGLNLLGLRRAGHLAELDGIDFVSGALEWCHSQDDSIRVRQSTFPDDYEEVWMREEVICFDVLEHQLNVGKFLEGVRNVLRPGGTAYFLVPAGREYYDCGHVAFFPDTECLRNVLDYVFEVDEIFTLTTCKKLFASCHRRA